MFLQQRWIYLGWAENCNSGSIILLSYMPVHHILREREPFDKKERKLETTVTQSPWFSIGWVPARKKEEWVFLLPVGLCHHRRAWELPLLVFLFYLIGASVCNFYVYVKHTFNLQYFQLIIGLFECELKLRKIYNLVLTTNQWDWYYY